MAAGSRAAPTTRVGPGHARPRRGRVAALAPRAGPGHARGAASCSRPAFAAIAVAVLVYGQTVRLNPVAVALAVLALLTVMVRMALLLRETATLAVSRKLSLTDDLTGPGQPARVHRRGRGRRRRRAAVRAAHDRPRPVQGAQRHPRPPRRRRAAAQRRPAAERHHASRRRRRPPGRRRVRRARQGRRHRDGRRWPRPACARRSGAPTRSPGSRCTSARASASPPSPSTPQDASTLLRHADVAMYEAKRGRLGHAVYASEGDHHSRDRLELAGEMRHALANDELTLHYQPVADLGDRTAARRRGARALAPPRARAAGARRLPARHRAHRADARAQPPRAGDGDLPGRRLVPPGAPVARGGQPVGHRPARPLAGRRRLGAAAPLRHAGAAGSRSRSPRASS